MARHAWIAGTLSVAKHVAVWALALGLHTALTSDASIPFAVVNGGLIGLMVGIAERAFLDGALRRRRRRPFMAVIAQRAAVYTTCWVTSAVVIVGTVLATSEWSLANLSGDDPRQEDFWAYYNSFRPTNISLQGALGVAFLLLLQGTGVGELAALRFSCGGRQRGQHVRRGTETSKQPQLVALPFPSRKT